MLSSILVKLIKYFLFWWDVVFTTIDILQLKCYYYIRMWKDSLESKQIKKPAKKTSHIKPLNDWSEANVGYEENNFDR